MPDVRSVRSVSSSLLAVAVLLLLASPVLPAEEGSKSLAETVRGTEKLSGLVTFYRAPGKLFLEVPPDLAGDPLGLGVTLVQAAGDWLPRGTVFDNSLVTWERAGDRLVLTKKNLDFRTAPSSLLRPTVEATFPESPVFLADLLPLTDRPAPLVVDAKGLFGTDLADLLPPESGFGTSPQDATLVSLEVFPENIAARVSYRFRRQEGRAAEREEGIRQALPKRLADPRFLEVLVDYQIYRLPEDDGYRPRFSDERIGTFDLPYKDYTDIDRKDGSTSSRRMRRRSAAKTRGSLPKSSALVVGSMSPSSPPS